MAPLDNPLNPPRKKKVGFAKLDPEARRAMGAKGGGAPRKTPRGFALDKTRAIEAGRKGGSLSKGGGRPPGTYTPAQRARASNMGKWNGLRHDPMFPKQEE